MMGLKLLPHVSCNTHCVLRPKAGTWPGVENLIRFFKTKNRPYIIFCFYQAEIMEPREINFFPVYIHGCKVCIMLDIPYYSLITYQSDLRVLKNKKRY